MTKTCLSNSFQLLLKLFYFDMANKKHNLLITHACKDLMLIYLFSTCCNDWMLQIFLFSLWHKAVLCLLCQILPMRWRSSRNRAKSKNKYNSNSLTRRQSGLFHQFFCFRCFALSPHSSKRLTSALIQLTFELKMRKSRLWLGKTSLKLMDKKGSTFVLKKCWFLVSQTTN